MVAIQHIVEFNMEKILIDKLYNYGIVPVIAINNVEDAIPLAKALIDGGLPVAEVTFRTEAAEESIRLMSEEFPELILAAGTVLTIDQVDKAVAAGAHIIVSPGLNPRIVKYCQSINVPVIPGTSTPSDLEAALELGLDVVKFFPAEANGGIAAIKAMSAPYGNLRFMPTGGINENNLLDYLSFDKIVCCGGSWMVKSDLIDSGKFDDIRDLTASAVSKMLDIKLDHISFGADDYLGNVSYLEKFLMSNKITNESSSLIGNIEIIKELSKNGILHFTTNDVERAVFHLELQGITFDKTSAVYTGNKLESIYANNDLAGYTLQLIRK